MTEAYNIEKWSDKSSQNSDFKVESSIVRGQQLPRDKIWIGITCDISESKSKLYNTSTTERMTAYFNKFSNSN